MLLSNQISTVQVKCLAQKHNRAQTHLPQHSNHLATIHPPPPRLFPNKKKINKYWLKKVNYMYHLHSRLSKGNTDCKVQQFTFLRERIFNSKTKTKKTSAHLWFCNILNRERFQVVQYKIHVLHILPQKAKLHVQAGMAKTNYKHDLIPTKAIKNSVHNQNQIWKNSTQQSVFPDWPKQVKATRMFSL